MHHNSNGMRENGSVLTTFASCRIPVIGGKDLDLHHLFVEVTSRGGIGRVMLKFCLVLWNTFWMFISQIYASDEFFAS